jgi:protoheme IX farnesyltransferase
MPEEKRFKISIYTSLLVPVTLLPWILGFAGPIYGAVALAAGANMSRLAWRLRVGAEPEQRAARRLFAFSVMYLFALFAAYLGQKGVTTHFWTSLRA